MNNQQDHNLLREKGEHGELTLRHQLTRLVWNTLWLFVKCLFPTRYVGGGKTKLATSIWCENRLYSSDL